MSLLTPLLAKITEGTRLTPQEAESAFTFLMSGDASEAEIGGFLIGLRTLGETASDITAAARVMRAKSRAITAPPDAIDCCGTGGSGHDTWNISTAAALIVAACGVPMAKHGNRAASSRCGSADVLRALGVSPDITPEQAEHCLREAGIAFLFAPTYHPAVRHVAPTRRALGVRTIFNLLGPLCNPAGVKRQLIGVFSRDWTRPLAETLAALGSERVWVVHCDVDGEAHGLDELGTTGLNHITEWRSSVEQRKGEPGDAGAGSASGGGASFGTAARNGSEQKGRVGGQKEGGCGGSPPTSEALAGGCNLRDFQLDAHAELGIPRAALNDLRGGDTQQNADALRAVLANKPSAYRDAVLLNAAAALTIAGDGDDLAANLSRAEETLNSGAALDRLNRLTTTAS